MCHGRTGELNMERKHRRLNVERVIRKTTTHKRPMTDELPPAFSSLK